MGPVEEHELVIRTILRTEQGFLFWKDGIPENIFNDTGVTIERFEIYLRGCIKGGNKLEQKAEGRDDWKELYAHTYQIVLPLFKLFPKGYFVEFCLNRPGRQIVEYGKFDEDDARVQGVSAHEEKG